MIASQINSCFPFYNLTVLFHVSKTPLLAYGGWRKNFNKNFIKSMLSSRLKNFYMGVLDTFFFPWALPKPGKTARWNPKLWRNARVRKIKTFDRPRFWSQKKKFRKPRPSFSSFAKISFCKTFYFPLRLLSFLHFLCSLAFAMAKPMK